MHFHFMPGAWRPQGETTRLADAMISMQMPHGGMELDGPLLELLP